jgi:hypothetical protein
MLNSVRGFASLVCANRWLLGVCTRYFVNAIAITGWPVSKTRRVLCCQAQRPAFSVQYLLSATHPLPTTSQLTTRPPSFSTWKSSHMHATCDRYSRRCLFVPLPRQICPPWSASVHRASGTWAAVRTWFTASQLRYLPSVCR